MNEAPPLLVDLFEAYFDARRHKRMTQSALRFEMNFEEQVCALYEELVSRTYRISPATCFVVTRPVQREIFAGAFRDRVVHHLVYNYLSPLCERIFIHDSYACRVGKGTSFGIRRADHFVRSVSENYTRDCYVLKLDIKGYFMAINKTILYGKTVAIVERYRDSMPCDVDFLLWLLRTIVFHDHTQQCIVRGRASDWDGLPPTKSLFHASFGCGLPIGNLTSQMFGNIYLNDFDHIAMRIAPGIRYGRYVDDMVFMSCDASFHTHVVPRVRAYLRDELHLTVHPKKLFFQHYTKGFDFLGVTVRPGRIHPRHRIKGNMHRAIALWNARAKESKDALEESEVTACVASLNAYLGGMAQYRTRRLRVTMCGRISKHFLRYLHVDPSFRRVRMS